MTVSYSVSTSNTLTQEQ